MISSFYKAWETGDRVLLESFVSPDLYGARVFDETVLYDASSFLEYLATHPIGCVDITIVQTISTVVLYEVTYRDSNNITTAKAELRDGKIVKLYETIKTDLTRLKCVCSYDGSSFYGYQKQPHEQTIQGTLEQVIYDALKLSTKPTIHASGRTDRGVHARGQVFHVDVKTPIPTSKIADLVNKFLPDSIHIIDVEEVPQTFHSRYDVITKTYRYKINSINYDPIQRNYEWYVPGLDVDRLKIVFQDIIGTHDFQSFTKAIEASTVRTIYSVNITIQDNHILIDIKGNGFLRYMVRYLVYAAVEITKGNLAYTMQELLTNPNVTYLKDMAPASGLYLYQVTYE